MSEAMNIIQQSPISPKRIGETWRGFLAALSSDELCELDRLVFAARAQRIIEEAAR